MDFIMFAVILNYYENDDDAITFAVKLAITIQVLFVSFFLFHPECPSLSFQLLFLLYQDLLVQHLILSQVFG